MLTATQAADVLNLVETSALNSLDADAWLKTGGTGGIGLVRPWAVGADRRYQGHELPAIVVRATQMSPASRTGPAGADELGVRLVVEVLDAGANAEAVTANARTIAARLRQWIAAQSVAGGNRLDGLLDDGDGVIAPGEIRFVDEKPVDGTFWAVARIEATVTLRAAV